MGGWSRGVGVRWLGSEDEVGGLGGDLGLGGCSWFKITLKVLQFVYKYLAVSCAVFNYRYLVVGLKAPCGSL